MQLTKEQIRKWKQSNQNQNRPPPNSEQIRRELGWGLITENKSLPDKK